MAKDWAETAARVIMLRYDLKRIAPQDTSVYGLAEIIREHCPVKPDMAYMPVPRCETCKHWKHRGIRNYCENPTLWLRASLTFVPPIETEGDFGCVQWEAK